MRRLEEMSEKLVSLQAASKADFFGLSHKGLHYCTYRVYGRKHSAQCTAGNESRAAAPLIRSGLAKTSRGHICIFLLRSAHRSR